MLILQKFCISDAKLFILHGLGEIYTLFFKCVADHIWQFAQFIFDIQIQTLFCKLALL